MNYLKEARIALDTALKYVVSKEYPHYVIEHKMWNVLVIESKKLGFNYILFSKIHNKKCLFRHYNIKKYNKKKLIHKLNMDYGLMMM